MLKHVIGYFILTFAISAYGQTFNSPIQISHNTTITDNLNGSAFTFESPSPYNNCQSSQPNKWYEFTAQSNYLQIDFTNVPEGAGLTLWSVSDIDGSVEFLQCYTAWAPQVEYLFAETNLNVGNNYLLAVRSTDVTNFGLSLSSTDTRLSLFLEKAIPLSHNSNTTDNLVGRSFESIPDVGWESCMTNQPNKWYKFTAVSDYLQIDFTNVPEGAGISLWSVGHNENPSTFIKCYTAWAPQLNYLFSEENLTVGDQYLLAVRSTDISDFTLGLSSTDTRLERFLNEAIPIGYNSQIVDNLAGRVFSQIPDQETLSCQTQQPNKWYIFTATSDSLHIDFTNVEEGAGITLWSVSSDQSSTELVNCFVAWSYEPQKEFTQTNLVSGMQYLLAIRSTEAGQYSFQLSGREASTYWRKNENTLYYDELNQNVAIGTNDSRGYKLAVNGKTITEEVKVTLAENWPDYVFDSDYALREIHQLEEFIASNKHLPDVPNRLQIESEGFNLGEMDARLLKKIEELTLYLINLNKSLGEARADIEELKSQNSELKKLLGKP